MIMESEKNMMKQIKEDSQELINIVKEMRMKIKNSGYFYLDYKFCDDIENIKERDFYYGLKSLIKDHSIGDREMLEIINKSEE